MCWLRKAALIWDGHPTGKFYGSSAPDPAARRARSRARTFWRAMSIRSYTTYLPGPRAQIAAQHLSRRVSGLNELALLRGRQSTSPGMQTRVVVPGRREPRTGSRFQRYTCQEAPTISRLSARYHNQEPGDQNIRELCCRRYQQPCRGPFRRTPIPMAAVQRHAVYQTYPPLFAAPTQAACLSRRCISVASDAPLFLFKDTLTASS